VHGQLADLGVDDQPEHQSGQADQQAPQQQAIAGDPPQERGATQLGQDQAGFAAPPVAGTFFRRGGEG
jgi:hypothetical protein